jgi:hypothetical protein
MCSPIRSAVMVILCLIIADLAHAQWPLGRDVAQQTPKSSEHGDTITLTGRYQVFVSPHVKGHTFMLDTDTGRVWIMKKDSTTGDFSFQRIPVDQIDSQQAGTSVPDKSKPGEKETSKQK